MRTNPQASSTTQSRTLFSLDDWLQWMDTLHPSTIDMGLDRIARVADNMRLNRIAPVVITVAGTNGKGSCVAILAAILKAAGYRVGCYTSPHLLRYNERVVINDEEASDEELCAAFARVDAARDDTTLTYFEFGTLAALDLFKQASLDIAVLEVGLGGRLDAVNIVDADASLITSIGIDHVEYLGDDRELIAVEKAGVLRNGLPAVCGDPNPPETLLECARDKSVPLMCIDRDFGYESDDEYWSWWHGSHRLEDLPAPALPGDVQLTNAASVLMVLEELAEQCPVSEDAIRQGLKTVYLPGRFQVVPGDVEQILDVCHNPDGARALAASLLARPVKGHTYAVIAMLADKDIEGVVKAMEQVVDSWHVASLDVPRGADSEALAATIKSAGIDENVRVYQDVGNARQGALNQAKSGDRVVVFGSFYTVGQALQQ